VRNIADKDCRRKWRHAFYVQ